ncbi:MAG: aldo/keto reductase, partial [Promethearchaeota archaeon]
MKYRKMGSLDWKVSALGFGAMRLPMIKEGDTEKVDVPEAIRIIRYGIDNGINYVDTAWPYHGGESEKIVGQALKDGYRDKVKLVSKLPMWEVKKT